MLACGDNLLAADAMTDDDRREERRCCSDHTGRIGVKLTGIGGVLMGPEGVHQWGRGPR